MFKRYTSVAEALHYDSETIAFYAIGGIAVAVASAFVGFRLLYDYEKRNNRNQFIYLPLGLFFVFCTIRVGLMVAALWVNYARLMALVTLLWGIIAFWILGVIGKAIAERNEANRVYDLGRERELLDKQLERVEKISRKTKDC